MDEKAFLELLDRECVEDLPSKDEFIHEHVFGYKKINLSHKVYWKKGNKCFARYETPYYQSWQGMGKGIEHANENGWYVKIDAHEENSFNIEVSRCDINHKVEAYYSDSEDKGVKTIFLAFWIAYMKALGVLE